MRLKRHLKPNLGAIWPVHAVYRITQILSQCASIARAHCDPDVQLL